MHSFLKQLKSENLCKKSQKYAKNQFSKMPETAGNTRKNRHQKLDIIGGKDKPL